MPKNSKFLGVFQSAGDKIKSGLSSLSTQLKQESQTQAQESLEQNNLLNSQRLPSWRQIKYLPKFLSPKEKLVIRIALIIIILSVAGIAYLFLRDNLVTKPAKGGVYTENVVGAPQHINPLYASINEADRDLTKLIFAGLVKFDAQRNIIPDLAKDWFVDESQTKYTFLLRDNIQWPDEKSFSSQDVVFTIEAIKNSDYQSPLKNNWSGIEIAAIDDYTVQFILPESFAPFLESLTVGILPAHLWQDILPENANLAELNIKPVGLGPYKFESFTKDKEGYIKSYTLTKNKNYHLGTPYIDQITFKFQPTFEVAVDSLKNRNADGLNYLPYNLKEFLEPRKDLNYYSLSLPQYTAIFFNQDKNPLLKNINMRRALNLAIDKNKIIEDVLGGEANTIIGPLLPGFPGYDQTIAMPEFNVEESKKILGQLGWNKKEIDIKNNDNNNDDNNEGENENQPEIDAGGMSKFLFKADQELAVTLTLANQPQAIAVGELVQKYWQAIGVKTYLNIVEATQIQKDVIAPREFEALLFGEILGSDPDPYAFWHSSQADEKGLNLANFKNSAADKLLEQARQETDEAKRAEKYIQFQNILVDQIPAIFLYNPNYTYVVSDKIKGIQLERIVSPADRLNGVEQWHIKTRKGFK